MNMKKEIWKDVIGYKGLYQISNCGRVESLSRYVKSDYRCRFIREKILRVTKDKKGYMRVKLQKNKIQKNFFIHRLVLTAFDRPPKPGEQCNHKNGIKDDNMIENLEWCTLIENCSHRDNVLGKHSRGIRNGRCVFTEKDVINIRDKYKNSQVSQNDIAKEYGVSRGAIKHIVCRETWKHIESK